jgi:hypothetical protein
MHVETPPVETVAISRLAWEMAQFELHLLRSVVAARWSAAQYEARAVKIARESYLQAMSRAMRDPDFRRSAQPISEWPPPAC